MTRIFILISISFLVFVHLNAQTGLWSKYADHSWDPVASDYKIESAAQLAQLAVMVNKGNTFENKTFTLINDIDLSAHFWIPIGEESSTPFCGIFDGNDNIIKGLEINNNKTDYPGTYSALFGRLGGNARLQYIVLTDGEIKGGMGDGALTAALAAEVSTDDDSKPIYISNCYNHSVKVTAGSGARGGCTGGLIAAIRTSSDAEKDAFIFIESSGNKSPVSGVSTSNFTGGVAGLVSAGNRAVIDIRDCYNCADITGSKESTGGLIGRMQAGDNGIAMLTNCKSSGKINGGDGYTGGLVGHLKATGVNSTAKIISSDVVNKELKGNAAHTGAFVGKNEKGMLDNNSEGRNN